MVMLPSVRFSALTTDLELELPTEPESPTILPSDDTSSSLAASENKLEDWGVGMRGGGEGGGAGIKALRGWVGWGGAEFFRKNRHCSSTDCAHLER